MQLGRVADDVMPTGEAEVDANRRGSPCAGGLAATRDTAYVSVRQDTAASGSASVGVQVLLKSTTREGEDEDDGERIGAGSHLSTLGWEMRSLEAALA